MKERKGGGTPGGSQLWFIPLGNRTIFTSSVRRKCTHVNVRLSLQLNGIAGFVEPQLKLLDERRNEDALLFSLPCVALATFATKVSRKRGMSSRSNFRGKAMHYRKRQNWRRSRHLSNAIIYIILKEM